MFQLDDNFLKELGLDGLPEDQKTAFLEHIYDQLEIRVGTRLAEGLDDMQLSEFESLIEKDEDKVREWLSINAPQYEQDEAYQKMRSTLQPSDEVSMLSEYAATKWLELNRPDYRSVVSSVLEDIKAAIINDRDKILD